MIKIPKKYFTAWGSGTTVRMLKRVETERARQRMLLDQGKFKVNVSSCAVSETLKLPVLGEEFGEVSKEVVALTELSIFAKEQRIITRQRLQAELIQLAAVSVAWAEALDKNERA